MNNVYVCVELYVSTPFVAVSVVVEMSYQFPNPVVLAYIQLLYNRKNLLHSLQLDHIYVLMSRKYISHIDKYM